MRSHFTGKKQTEIITTQTSAKSSIASDTETLQIDMRNETELVIKQEDRLCSFLFVTGEEECNTVSFLSFMRRIGFPEENLPSKLIQMVRKNEIENEQSKTKFNLCPYIVI